MSKPKKIILWVAVVIIVAGVAFGVTWLGINWDKLTSKTEVFTYQELLDYGEERYQSGVQQGESYRVLMLEYQKNLAAAESKNNQLTIELNSCKAERDNYLEQVENLSSSNEDYQEQLALLTQNIEDCNEQIDAFESQIATLESEKLTLNNEIARLTALLEETELYKIEYVNGDDVVYTNFVNPGASLEILPTIENTYYSWFYGWETEEGTAVDATYVPTSDLTLYAETSECVTVELKFNDEDMKYVRVGSRFTVGEVLNLNSELMNDSNLETTIKARLNNVLTEIDLSQLITELTETALISTRVDGSWKSVYGYSISVETLYNFEKIYVPSTTAFRALSVEDVPYQCNFDAIYLKNFKLSYGEVDKSFSELTNLGMTGTFYGTYCFEVEDGVLFYFRSNYDSIGVYAYAESTGIVDEIKLSFSAKLDGSYFDNFVGVLISSDDYDLFVSEN